MLANLNIRVTKVCTEKTTFLPEMKILELLIQANLKIIFSIQFPWKWVSQFLVVATTMTIPEELQKKKEWLNKEEGMNFEGSKISY